MRAVNWLHISDLHFRADSEWAQDVVLTEMCRHIERLRNEGLAFDFILVTGDIAFSGQPAEYAIAEHFFDDLELKAGVNRNKIFCVPGNHDIDRSKQKMAFTGASSSLQDTESVDNFLADITELQNILARQVSFREFQETYFAGQDRQWTVDGLAYISKLGIDDLSLAIVGLDSAWLAKGGGGDHGNLLIGERQVINAMRLALESDSVPNVVVVMSHHPFHLLKEFDHLTVQTRVERNAHFFHHGHLHQAGTRMAGPSGSKCLTVAAGASYATRLSHNAYSVVKLDLFDSLRSVRTFVFDPVMGTYTLYGDEETYPIDIMPTSPCSVTELAEAIPLHDSQLGPYAYYLASLILRQKSEFPIAGLAGPVFASIDFVHSLPDHDLQYLAIELMRFGNVLKVLHGRQSLAQILSKHSTMFTQYTPILIRECTTIVGLQERLIELNEDAQRLAGIEPRRAFLHTHHLLEQLCEQGEWVLLSEHAERHLDARDQELVLHAKRMFALALANIGGSENQLRAIDYYRSLAASDSVAVSDITNLAILLINIESMEEAVSMLFTGIELFPENAKAFLEIGQTIVSETGTGICERD